MSEVYLPYGAAIDGRLVHIDEVVARGRTALVCPYCGVALLARKGEVVTAHFAHDGQTCRAASSAKAAFSLPVYDSFNVNLSGREMQLLKVFYELGQHRMASADKETLRRCGVLALSYTHFGNKWYSLTHTGKVPFGDLSLNLFNQLQERLIMERYERLAADAPESETRRIDLQIYRAQLRRVLAASLYFLRMDVGGEQLHKIGVTARPLEQRVTEIYADLRRHFGDKPITIEPLRMWPHRGAAEPYFKHRYSKYQYRIGTLTEYFKFDENLKSVRLDLARMKPKTLTDLEREILEG